MNIFQKNKAVFGEDHADPAYADDMEVSEREEVLGCCYNGILRLTTLLREDAEKDDDLGKALETLNLAFENLESHWDFYHRAYMLDEPLM